MKNRVLLFIAIILLISISSASALDIELISPAHGSVYEITSTVNFKCKPTGENLVQLSLITDISGTPEATGTPISNPTNNTEYTFTINNIENGVYNWNCQILSSSAPFQAIEPTDRQLTVDFQNDPPTFSGTIPDQTWNQDASVSNTFDLDNYFTDPDTITYSITGNNNIVIDINSDNQVSFSQPAGWWGTETVTFKATDNSGTTDSNQVLLTVNQVNSNNENPVISGVPDQTAEPNDEWTLSLDSYLADNEDSDSALTISITGVDTSIFTISIDQSNNELDFTALTEGTDDFTITVNDTDGATNSQIVTVTIEEETTSSSSNDDEDYSNEFDDNDISVEISSSTPTYDNITLSPGESQSFEISTNTYDIIWYVDNSKEKENSRTFTYKPTSSNEGEHIIKVIVGSGIDKDMKSWDIKVKGKNSTTKTTSTTQESCGNSKIDENENCLTCPEDSPCQDGEYCDEGSCKQKGLNKITGYITDTKEFIIDKWYYPTLVLGVIILLIIFSRIIKLKKKEKNKDSDYLADFKEEKTWKQRLRAKLREWDKKRSLKKQNQQSLKRLETEKREDVRATAPGIESITTFINQKQYEGNSKGEIKRALRKKSWSRKQIRLAYKKSKNDSKRTNPTN